MAVGSARLIADRLRRDGYGLTNYNEVILGLVEDLGYSYEEAVSVAQAVMREGR